MSTVITPSISSFTTGDFLDEISAKSQIELVTRRGTNGDFKKGRVWNPTSDISIKGGGAPEITVGLATIAYTGLSGGVKYITDSTHKEVNNDFDDFESSGKHLPNASDVA